MTDRQWQVQDAKQRFSELIRQARSDGAQFITRHGAEVAVVLDIDEYRRLSGESDDFKSYLRQGPRADLDVERGHDLPREVDLELRAMSYLLDTNVVSELRRARPHRSVLAWFDGVGADELHLSVLTVGEIRQGIERLRSRDPQRADRLDRWLAGLVTSYRRRIVPVDSAVAERWGRLNVPDPVPVVDGLLAATALVRDWTLVTRNVTDFERTGVTTLNPFDP